MRKRETEPHKHIKQGRSRKPSEIQKAQLVESGRKNERSKEWEGVRKGNGEAKQEGRTDLWMEGRDSEREREREGGKGIWEDGRSDGNIRDRRQEGRNENPPPSFLPSFPALYN